MPQIGDYLVTPTDTMFGRLIRFATKSKVNHAAVYIGGGRIVEADTKGAVISPVTDYPDATWSTMPLDWRQRGQIAFQARLLVGTKYNFLDIAVQALVRVLHWRAPRWALRRCASAKRLQCAQLVELAYHRAGIELSPRTPLGLVSPGDLYDTIERAE